VRRVAELGSLGGIIVMRASLPIWFRAAAGVWAVLAVLWFFSCYHFAGGQLRVDGWWMNCRPEFEDSYAMFVSVVALVLLIVVSFIARAIYRRSHRHANAA